MNVTLSSDEIMQDLSEIAIRILWNKSGQCSLQDMIEAGADESAVAKYGADVLSASKRVFNGMRAA